MATKFMPRTPEQIASGVTIGRHIERMLDQSLTNLGMDAVDLYILHMWDDDSPLDELMEGLDRMVRARKTRYIGVSNCLRQLAQANALAEREGLRDLSACRATTT